MNCSETQGSELANRAPSARKAAQSTRYHGLDGVRATAMLLGVFYHLPIAMMAGGFGMGFGFGANPKTSIDNWLHSFRMPLFFLISGFFASMVLGKYGWNRYLTRRWWRIGAPLFIAFFVFAGVRFATDYFRPANQSPFGFPPSPFGAPPPGPGGLGAAVPTPTSTATPHAAGGTPAPGTGPSPAPTSTTEPDAPSVAPLGPPTGGGFGAPGGTPFGPPPTGGFGAPGGMPFGPPGGGFGAPGAGPFGPPGGGFGAPGNAMAGGPLMPMGPPPMEIPRFPSRTWADRLLGTYSRFFNLEHLWFLWYLLVFVTIAPLVARVVAVVAVRPIPEVVDRVGVALIRWNLIAVVLGVVSLPALVHARGFMGWSLANPIGFLAPFPDFLCQYHADFPYYFLCFLAGWWFFRLRDHLSDFGRTWLWSLVLGIAGYAASQALSDRYFMQTASPNHDWIRLVGFALYGTGAAYTACAFLGFFQRYLDRPSRVGRYFADTALWVYLIHLPLIPYLIWWIQPSRSAWWGASLAGMVLVTGVALVLFELLVRPTPLMYIFGPPVPRRAAPAEVPQAATLPASSAHIH